MRKLFDANWRTSVSGLIAITCTVIATKPQLIAFLPDVIETYVGGIASIVAAVSGYYFVFQAKDKKVTGGTIAQTPEAVERTNEPSAWAGLS